MKFALLTGILACFPVLWAQRQQDSVQLIGEMQISAPLQLSPAERQSGTLSTAQIEAMQANDVGDVLRKLSGVNLRSYGGLGGLKTVSFRSLGSQHSAVVLDGYTVLNNQNGQVNLGQIQAANLVGVQDLQAEKALNLLPVSAMVAGGTFFLQSFEQVFGDTVVSLRANSSVASFGQLDEFLAGRWRKKNWQIGGSGGWRKAEGNYPYRYQNGSQTNSAIRENNDYEDFNAAAMIGRKTKQTSFRLGYRGKQIDQGLPGAVVFYYTHSDERMLTREHVFSGDFEHYQGVFDFRIHAQASQQGMHYSDPDFLNNSGGISEYYDNRVLNGGIMSIWRPGKFILQFGTEEIVSNLTLNKATNAQAERLHNLSLISARYHWWRLRILTQLTTQYVSERQDNAAVVDRFRVNPMLRISLRAKKKAFEQFVWYRSTFRMPSFNELYYSGTGNKNLLPEDAHLVNYGLSWENYVSSIQFSVQSNVFMNWVKNKIVAIPTQNLFVWSMLNVGQSLAYGGDAVLGIDYDLRGKWRLKMNLNYTFLRSLDYTDRESPTWMQQLAYVPIHTGNVDLDLRYDNTGLLLSNYLISQRYALNENIPQNEVEGFWIADVSVYHNFEFRNKQRLTIRGSVKNLFDQSYAYIRSFAMPGRSYQITLNYALH